MKKTIFTILFLLFVVFVFGQKTTQIKKEERDSILPKSEINLVGKWKLDSMQSVGLKRITKAKYTRTWIFEFFKNNSFAFETYSYKGADDKFSSKGTWKVENGDLNLIQTKSKNNSGGPKMPFVIEKLTYKKLICSQEATEEVSGAIFYFIRVE